jgi:hypothetical protein
MSDEPDAVSADLGASATVEIDTVDTVDETVRTRVLSSDGEPFGVELGLDLGAVTAEVVLDREAALALSARLEACAEEVGE